MQSPPPFSCLIRNPAVSDKAHIAREQIIIYDVLVGENDVDNGFDVSSWVFANI